MFSRCVIVGSFLCLSFSDIGSASVVELYTVVDLGVSPGGDNVFPEAINNTGQVVGVAANGPYGEYTTAFLYSGGATQWLNGDGAFGINDNGMIIGGSYYSNIGHAIYWTEPGSAKQIPTGNVSANATAVNNSGQIVVNLSGNHAYSYSAGGSLNDLGMLGGTSSFGTSINNKGQIVGYASTTADALHAFLYSDGFMSDIGTLGGTSSSAEDINDKGTVVGSAKILTGQGHAFRYASGVMTDLGTLSGLDNSYATGINADGLIVGFAMTSSGLNSHAFLYNNGVMQDLNSLIDPSAGWNLSHATAINDNGWIVGYGLHNSVNTSHGFLLIPVPESSTLTLLCIGAISLLAYSWRGQNRRV
jgi:probable HAF family extracellular repeat protein